MVRVGWSSLPFASAWRFCSPAISAASKRQGTTVQISLQRFDSMWFIEIQVRLVIFVIGRTGLACGVARAVTPLEVA